MQEPGDLDLFRVGRLAGGAAICLWAIVYLAVPPSFSGTDIFYFKDAGLNLAAGRGLVTRLGPGHPDLEPSFYATYPPAFPVLYGVVVGLVGAGPKVNQMFDLLISCAAGLAFLFALLPRSCRRDRAAPHLLLLAAILISLPLGPAWAEKERPDSLGLLLALAGVRAAEVSRSPRGFLLAGLLLGVNGLVSPFCFLVHGACLLVLCACPVSRGEPPPHRFDLRALLASCVAAALPLAVAALTVWWLHPDTARRFLGHALGTSTGGASGLGYLFSLASGNVGGLLDAAGRYVTVKHKVKLLFLILATLVTVGGLLGRASMRRQPANRVLALSIPCMAAVSVVLFPYQWSYMSVTAALILVMFARFSAATTVRDRRLVSWAVLACFGTVAAFEAVFIVRGLTVASQSGTSLPRMQHVLDGFRPPPGQAPLLVATSYPTYFLFKGAGFEPVNTRHLDDRGDQARLDLAALSFVGSRDPEKPLYPPWWRPDEWELIYRPALPQRTRFLGFVSQGSNTWEVELYRRRR